MSGSRANISNRPDSFMPLYIGDYLADTAHLSAAEHGAYLLLIMAYWRNGGPIKADDGQLMRVTRMNFKEWALARKVVLPFFDLIEGALHHGRIDAELTSAQAKYEKRKAAAHASHKARSSNAIAMHESSTGKALAEHMHPEPDPDPHSSNEEKKQEKSIVAAVATTLPAVSRVVSENETFPSTEDLHLAIQHWNFQAARLGLAQVKDFTDKRRRHLRNRLETLGSLDDWIALIDSIEHRPFCRGENQRGWRVDFDFAVSEAGCTKLREGNWLKPGMSMETTHAAA